MDINDDKHMEWKEFTQYIIDSVMVRNPNKKRSTQDKKQTGNSKLDQTMDIQMPNGGGGDFFEDEMYNSSKGKEDTSSEGE